jgi:proton-dependent oligopeptide transporter, POT family
VRIRAGNASETRPSEFLGHPSGLAVLFAAEAWERFSYFGNAALIVLYMVKYLLQPGRMEAVLGFATIKAMLELMFGELGPQPLASQIFGFYTGLAYSAPILGGILADRLLGQKRMVLIGGVLMAIGHFMMAVEPLFFLALLMLILGIGAFKPNVSTQVGALYSPGDSRRDRAYSIFYLGINIGAFLAPLVCGALAARYGWDYGFGAAGLGMLLSLGIYLSAWRSLPEDEIRRARPRDRAEPPARTERDAVLPLIGICATVALFWAAYDQQSNALMLWIEDLTDRSVNLGFWQGEIPSAFFLSINPFFIFILTPVLVSMWAREGERGSEPSPIRKMAFGCLCLTLANVLMAGAAWSATGKASPLWLLGYFGLATLGELHVAPIGLALISRRAPAHALSMLMGVWFAATLPGEILGGFLSGLWSGIEKPKFFLIIGSIAALTSFMLWLQRSTIVSSRRGSC